MARLGVTTRSILDTLLRLWAYVMAFRRPLFCVFQAVYQQAHSSGADDLPFRLTPEVKMELLMAASLGPLSLTDLRAPFDDQIYCADASPHGAGACAAWVGREGAEVLWQLADHLGRRLVLLSPAATVLRARGL